LVVKVRKSLRDGKRHYIEKKRCDGSMGGEARKDASEKGCKKLGISATKLGCAPSKPNETGD